TPPEKESVARRSGNGTRGIEFARTMEEGRTENDVATPVLGHLEINDRIDHEGVDVAVSSGRLRQRQGRTAQRQVVKLKIETESEVLAVVPRNTGSKDSSAFAYISVRRPMHQACAAADVKSPVLVIMRLLFFGLLGFFGRRFLAAAGLIWLLGLRLRVRRLCGGLLSVCGCDSHQDCQAKY